MLSLALALLPLPASYYLGNKGEPLLAVIAPLLLIIALGLVCASWWLLLAIMWPISRFSSTVDRRCMVFPIDICLIADTKCVACLVKGPVARPLIAY